MCKEALTPILNEEYRRMFTALLLVGEEKKKKKLPKCPSMEFELYYV